MNLNSKTKKKALQLLEYLIKNGSERVVDDARNHIYEIRALQNYNYVDEKRKDQGLNGGIDIFLSMEFWFIDGLFS